MKAAPSTSAPPKPVPSAREAFVSDWILARRAAWIRGNTSESPFGKSTPGEPSPQHFATWREMAEAEATRAGLG